MNDTITKEVSDEIKHRRINNLTAYVISGDTKTERNRRIEEVPKDVREEVRRRKDEFERRRGKA